LPAGRLTAKENRPKCEHLGRLLKRLQNAPRPEGGGSRGNQGFPRAPYIMSGIPPGIPAAAGCFSGGSATTASVMRMLFAIEAAF
jgi:hypothetical protein